jgi:lysozyme family protein
VPEIEAYLRDSAFNRGPGGAAKILQMALGVTVDGGVGPETLGALHRRRRTRRNFSPRSASPVKSTR